MKQFGLLGMTLVALIMSVGLVACSSSDNDDNNGDGGNSPKKLTKVITSYEDGNEEAEFFSYDTNGKLKSYNLGGEIYTFNWTDDIVTITNNTEGKTETCYIADNLIRNSTVYNTKYYYNDNNKLTKIQTNFHTDSVKWDGDKITEQYYIFSYSGKTCKGFNPVIWVSSKNLFYGNYWLSACPELIGAKSNQLPDGFKNDNEEAKISYTFDSEGYVTEFTIQSTIHYYNRKYKLTWE